MAVKREVDFPRGGVRKKLKTEVKVQQKKDKDLFQVEKPGAGNEKKVKKRKTSKEKESKDDSGFKMASKITQVEQLDYVHLSPGMLVLGCIQEIGDYGLKVSLPGRLQGQVSIASISQPYKAQLEKIAEGDDSDNDVNDLKTMFRIGQKVACKVVSVTRVDTKHDVTLTLSPEEVNQMHNPYTLRKGMHIIAAIKSVEDHGYVMDLGVKGTNAFLASNDAKGYVEHWKFETLSVGQLLPCAVLKVDASDSAAVVTLTANPKKVEKTRIAEDADVKVHLLLPGQLIDVSMQKVLKGGLQVKAYGLTAYIPETHTRSTWDSVDSYSDIESLSAVVMYVMPITNHIYLSLKPSLLSTLPPKPWPGQLKPGQVVNCEVAQVTTRGTILKVEKAMRGFATMKHSSDSTFCNAMQLRQELKPGSTKPCRVFQYDYFDQVYVCSLKSSVVKSIMMTLEDAKIGQKVKASIVSMVENGGAVVRIGSMKSAEGVNGFIPKSHLSDLPLSRPQDRFQVGQKVACRVLQVDPQKHRLHLTAKPSLVSSKLKIISAFDQAQVDDVVLGTIFMMKEGGVLVSLYGDVKGWIPVSRLSSEHVESPEKNFYVGQTLKCRIVSLDSSKNRMVLSCRMKDANKVEKQPNFGDVIQCNVTQVFKDGLQIKSTENGATYFLPAVHLGDYPSLTSLMTGTYSPGDALKVVCYHAGGQSVWVTLKPSVEDFIKKCQAEGLEGMKDLKEGTIITGTVASKKDYGMFLKVPMVKLNKWLLVHIRNLSSSFIESMDTADIQIHQTVMAKVLEVDAESERVSLTASLETFWDPKDKGVAFLEGYLHNWHRILSHAWPQDEVRQKLVKHKMGSFIRGTVTKVTLQGVLLKLEDDVDAIVTSHHIGDASLEEGNVVKGVVIFIDVAENCLEVSLQPKVLLRAKQKKKDKAAKLKEGQAVIGEIVVVKPHLAILHVNETGHLVYLPVRKHINDFVPDTDQFKLEENVKAVVRSTVMDMVIATLDLKATKKKMKRKLKAAPEKSNKKVKQSPEVNKEKKAKVEQKVAITATETWVEQKVTITATKRKAKASEAEVKSKKVKKLKETSIEKAVKQEDDSTGKGKEKKCATTIAPHLDLSSGFVWDQDVPFTQLTEVKKEDESSDDEEEEVKTKKLSKSERESLEKQEELETEERERQLMDAERDPQTSEDFERLVMGSPNSSICWTKYMAFLLQATEIEKARAVAKRALATISFREEGERLNVWFAHLSMENLYGSQDSFNKCYAEALQANDALKVYKHVANLFISSGKIEQAEKVYETTRKKFKADKEVWIDFGLFYFQQGKPEEARKIMQRSLLSLPNREHIAVLNKFAHLEFQMGSAEVGKTMYEQILSTYPARVDLWNVYVDALVKSNDIDGARSALEKASSLNLRPKKMKSVFNKFLKFESQFGTPELQKKVRDKAKAYVESKAGDKASDDEEEVKEEVKNEDM